MKVSRNHQYNISKILNGYSFSGLADRKSEFRFDDSDFIYGMVGRGIREKGWCNVIKAFNRLEINNKKLVLIGEGPEIDDLRNAHKNDDKIIFVGYAPKPVEYIKLFHVAIFASYYSGESLPTVVIEYLACNKPLIATEIGEVKEMLQTQSEERAGLLINFNRDGVDDESLYKKMQTLYSDYALRNKLIKLTKEAFLKFDLQQCVDSYLNVYGKTTQ
jgi:glycosyltransferase involved in cell wall biosynthesis